MKKTATTPGAPELLASYPHASRGVLTSRVPQRVPTSEDGILQHESSPRSQQRGERSIPSTVASEKHQASSVARIQGPQPLYQGKTWSNRGLSTTGTIVGAEERSSKVTRAVTHLDMTEQDIDQARRAFRVIFSDRRALTSRAGLPLTGFPFRFRMSLSSPVYPPGGF